MFAEPRPSRNLHHYRSDDLDEVRSWVTRRDGEHSRVVHGTGAFGYGASILGGEATSVGWFHAGLRQTVRARFPWPCIHIPTGSAREYTCGRRRVLVGPGHLAFIPAGTEVTGHYAAGGMFAIKIDEVALTAEIQARLPDNALPWPMVPLDLELPGTLRTRFNDAVGSLVHALDTDASTSERTHCEGRVIAAIVDALTVPSGRARPAWTADRRLADLEAWIDAHVGETITIGRLCSVAQAGERALQLAFQSRRGMSPMRFVCERRLAAAYRRLADAGETDMITSIAAAQGFTHLSRFAKDYRATFGELPSETLQRGRARPVIVSQRNQECAAEFG